MDKSEHGCTITSVDGVLVVKWRQINEALEAWL